MLEYILVNTSDNDLLIHIYDILKECGIQMFKDYGLEHWLPAYSIDSIKKDCLDKFVFLVYDIDENKFISTFQMYISENDSLYIRKVATHPKYYGRGIGRRNLEFIKLFAKKLKLSSIELDVYDQSKQAIRFYQSNGFVVTGKKATKRFEVLLMKKVI